MAELQDSIASNDEKFHESLQHLELWTKRERVCNGEGFETNETRCLSEAYDMATVYFQKEPHGDDKCTARYTCPSHQSQLKLSIYTGDLPIGLSWYLFDNNEIMIANFTQYTEVYKFYYHEECVTSYPNTYMTLVLFNLASNIGNIVYSVEFEGFVYKNTTSINQILR